MSFNVFYGCRPSWIYSCNHSNLVIEKLTFTSNAQCIFFVQQVIDKLNFDIRIRAVFLERWHNPRSCFFVYCSPDRSFPSSPPRRRRACMTHPVRSRKSKFIVPRVRCIYYKKPAISIIYFVLSSMQAFNTTCVNAIASDLFRYSVLFQSRWIM